MGTSNLQSVVGSTGGPLDLRRASDSGDGRLGPSPSPAGSDALSGYLVSELSYIVGQPAAVMEPRAVGTPLTHPLSGRSSGDSQGEMQDVWVF